VSRNQSNRPAALSKNYSGAILGILALLFLVVAVKNAWLSDDAYITFRTADNFLAGQGMVYNIGERVQAFTHPLWLLLLVPLKFMFGQYYYPAIFASILFSVAAVLILLRIATDRWAGALGLAILLLSKAFMDYTTSGLENPLSYLLIGCFVMYSTDASRSRKGIAFLSLIAAALALNRLDTLLLTLPVLIYAFWQFRKDGALWSILIGLSPLFVWTLFSLIYYGSPFANTVYAKLDTGVPTSALIAQGFYYLTDSLQRDSLTLIAIVLGIGLAIRSKRPISVCVAIGMSLYLVYILSVGGDFMTGRFLSLPLFTAVLVLARQKMRWINSHLLIAGAAILLLSIPSWKGSLLSGPGYGDVPLVQTRRFGPLPLSLVNDHGISDERAFYYQATGLLRPHPGSFPTHQWATAGEDAQTQGAQVVVGYALGFYGYYAGPGVHLIDDNALTDFLMARLPVPKNIPWRIGHFARAMPQGYYESVVSGENQMADPDLGKFYDSVKLIISQPIFSSGRFAAIWKMNTGGYDDLIDAYVARNP
jgi:arabinofuranosyltransferase